jgi:hypothetical protein
LAETFEINVDSLEQELYSMDNIIKEYKDFPLWLRLYIGSGWLSATRKEFQRIEIFFVVCGLFTASFWFSSFYFSYGDSPLPFIEVSIGNLIGFCSVLLLLGAYNSSISIRLGDKYDIWSKLEATQPELMFGIFKRRKSNK